MVAPGSRCIRLRMPSELSALQPSGDSNSRKRRSSCLEADLDTQAATLIEGTLQHDVASRFQDSDMMINGVAGNAASFAKKFADERFAARSVTAQQRCKFSNYELHR